MLFPIIWFPTVPDKLQAVTADGENIACVDFLYLVTVHYDGLMHYRKESCTWSRKMALIARMLRQRLLVLLIFYSHLPKLFFKERSLKIRERKRDVKQFGCIGSFVYYILQQLSYSPYSAIKHVLSMCLSSMDSRILYKCLRALLSIHFTALWIGYLNLITTKVNQNLCCFCFFVHL